MKKKRFQNIHFKKKYISLHRCIRISLTSRRESIRVPFNISGYTTQTLTCFLLLVHRDENGIDLK